METQRKANDNQAHITDFAESNANTGEKEVSTQATEEKGMKTVTRFSGEKLRLLRELAGLTQVDMARKVRYRSSSDISRIESGEQVPRPRKIKALAKILNVPTQDLFAEIADEVTTESK